MFSNEIPSNTGGEESDCGHFTQHSSTFLSAEPIMHAKTIGI